MNIIFNNQFSIFEDIFYKYLNPKQCVKFYSSNCELYYLYNKNNKFESNYYTPKDKTELQGAVNDWCYNREEPILKYGHISYWNIINIIDIGGLFCNEASEINSIYDKKHYFNDNIGDWNTSNITEMWATFSCSNKFNQPIGNWNISKVNNMSYMFSDATEFNQSIDKWDTSNVRTMEFMFYNSFKFNQSINNWNICNLEYINSMFGDTYEYNQPMYKWDIKSIRYMQSMFQGAQKFNQDLNAWNINITIKLIDISNLFYEANNFNKLNCINWIVENKPVIFEDICVED